jgi:carbamoyl-phosphate synthase large subunit
MKFLITGANGDIAISICRILKQNFKKPIIVGTDIQTEGRGEFFLKKIYKISSPSNKNYIKHIINISKKYKVIIPTTEKEILFFSKNIKKFKNKIVLVNSPNIIRIFSNKSLTYNFLKKNNFSVPAFSERLSSIKKFKKIFFLKRDVGNGNKDYKIIKSTKEFVQLKNLNKKKWIAQEYLGSIYKEYTCAVVKLENFKDVLILNRKLDKGYTYYAEVVKNHYLKKTLLDLADLINLDGSINVQLKINKKKFAIFEINPRLSSTVMMRNKMGFKDFIWWLNYKLKKKLPKKCPKIKKCSMVKYSDEKFILR